MRAAISLILLAVLLAGCGYKGPLYLPTPKPEAQKPASKPAPAQVENKPEGE
jgi:predicted small lipoprotein YifL